MHPDAGGNLREDDDTSHARWAHTGTTGAMPTMGKSHEQRLQCHLHGTNEAESRRAAPADTPLRKMDPGRRSSGSTAVVPSSVRRMRIWTRPDGICRS